MSFGYDMTFCEGHNCKRKESCHRYRQLLRFRADKDPNRGDIISMTKPEDPDKCGIYWPEKP